MTPKRIGIFGGTFNPIHNGHTRLSQRVYEDFSLDKMYLVPSKIPPHKTANSVTAQQRFEMVKIAVEELEGNFDVSDFEISSEGVSYTYLTLNYFRQLYEEDILFFVTGSDIFATIETWHNWKELFDLSNFIVVNRPEIPFEEMVRMIPICLHSILTDINHFDDASHGRIILHQIPETKISSTEIRGSFKLNLWAEYLSKGVLDYIKKNSLYLEV